MAILETYVANRQNVDQEYESAAKVLGKGRYR